jgi:hypothetical protein
MIWLVPVKSTKAVRFSAPSPLVGEGGEGGREVTRWREGLRLSLPTPTPNPSPQGGGESVS